MSYVVKITPAAFVDIKTGIEYYNGEQKGLGKRFSGVIEKAITKIKEMPFSASIAYDDVRYKVVHEFPYVILYRIEGTFIHISRVFNTHQRPLY